MVPSSQNLILLLIPELLDLEIFGLICYTQRIPKTLLHLLCLHLCYFIQRVNHRSYDYHDKILDKDKTDHIKYTSLQKIFSFQKVLAKS